MLIKEKENESIENNKNRESNTHSRKNGEKYLKSMREKL